MNSSVEVYSDSKNSTAKINVDIAEEVTIPLYESVLQVRLLKILYTQHVLLYY